MKARPYGSVRDRIKQLNSEIPGLNLSRNEVSGLTHQLELLTDMLRQLDEIDLKDWEPAVVFTCGEKI